MSHLGFVGPGQLGTPMIERLTAAGHDVVVHARRAEVRAAVEELGAKASADLAEVGAAADLVIVCVYNDEQLEDVCTHLLESMRPGSVLVSHVTGRISTIKGIAERARERGIEVVDAALSGHAADIRAGRLTVMLGGEESARLAVEAAMAAYADPILHTGKVGTTMALKLVNNMLLAANLQLLAQAIDLVEELGGSEAAFLQLLATSSGGSYASASAARFEGLDKFANGAGHFLRKDVDACRDQAAELGLDPGLLSDAVERGRLPLTNR